MATLLGYRRRLPDAPRGPLSHRPHGGAADSATAELRSPVTELVFNDHVRQRGAARPAALGPGRRPDPGQARTRFRRRPCSSQAGATAPAERRRLCPGPAHPVPHPRPRHQPGTHRPARSRPRSTGLTPHRRSHTYLLTTGRSALAAASPRVSVKTVRGVFPKGMTLNVLRQDRILHEARASADPLHLMRPFGISASTAMRYVGTAYPERTAKLPRQRARPEPATAAKARGGVAVGPASSPV